MVKVGGKIPWLYILTKERVSLFSNWAGNGLGQNLDSAVLENGLLWVKCCCPDASAKDLLIITALKWRNKVCRKWRLEDGEGNPCLFFSVI